jgi:hypothetical protein
LEVEFVRTFVLRSISQQQQQQQGGYWRGSKWPQWLLGCVCLNTFTGVVKKQEPAGVELPAFVRETAARHAR